MLIYMFSNNILALNQIGLSNEILDPEDAFKMKVSDICLLYTSDAADE